MYYFLRHLALLDISLLSVTVPQSTHNSLTGSGCISYAQCVLQVFFFMSLASAEVAILTVMSDDGYVAICLPLHYEVIMSLTTCKWAMTAVWISGCILVNLYIATTFSVRLCRDKIIYQFFCDVLQLLKLSCSNDYPGVIGVVAFMSLLGFACFFAFTLSYVHIFSTVLRMPSVEVVSTISFISMIVTNVTAVTDFLLLGFSDNQELQILHALLSMMYLFGLAGNFIIITITTMDLQL
ncbi:olfactory receptor 14J1-like [Nannospalax galili]|uniref:olfactory receptor 14J1-like n=1 Tax=Nannospalax galili TaxID=1026970 RepID=UPI000819AB4B|nr:olfactory receptor 14J1-like [Nannospalax galili]